MNRSTVVLYLQYRLWIWRNWVWQWDLDLVPYILQCQVDWGVQLLILLLGIWYIRLCWRSCCCQVVVVGLCWSTNRQLRLVRCCHNEAEAHRCMVQENWEQLEAYLTLIESRAKDARIAFTCISDGSLASCQFTHHPDSWLVPTFLLDSS